jgi:hypothetical protein
VAKEETVGLARLRLVEAVEGGAGRVVRLSYQSVVTKLFIYQQFCIILAFHLCLNNLKTLLKMTALPNLIKKNIYHR